MRLSKTAFCQELDCIHNNLQETSLFLSKSAGGNDSATEKECIITKLKN